LAELDGQLAVLPGRVREYEIEETTLLARFLRHEQPVAALGEFESLDAVFEVVLVGGLKFGDLALDAVLLVAPLPLPALVGLAVDEPVEFVFVGTVDAVLEACVLPLETRTVIFIVSRITAPAWRLAPV